MATPINNQEITNMIRSSATLSLPLPPTTIDSEKVEMMHQIVELVLLIPRQSYLQKVRNREFVMRRAILANLMAIYTAYSDAEMGKELKMDRTSVLHHLRSHDALMQTDVTYRQWYVTVESLYARTNAEEFDEIPELSDMIKMARELNTTIEKINNQLGIYLVAKYNADKSEKRLLSKRIARKLEKKQL